MKNKHLLSFIIYTLALCACTLTFNNSNVRVSGVDILQEEVKLNEGETYTLYPYIYPSNATNINVTYKSDNPNIASVNSDGVVKAIKEGTSNITVTTVDGGYTDSCRFIVKHVDKPIETVKVSKITLSTNSLVLYPNDTYHLSYNIFPSNATDQSVTWSSSNNDVITVNNGDLTAKSLGKATITVTSNDSGVKDICEVEVKENSSDIIKVESVSLNVNNLTLKVGKTYNLVATVSPNNATDKSVYYSSSDSSVASVFNGEITARSVGEATIEVITNDGGKTASCAVKVESNNVSNNKYLLNSYGDYMEYVDSSKDASTLESEYKRLSSTHKYSSNGVLEANYEVGLYEFFNIENKVEISINMSKEELTKLDNDHKKNNKETYRICSLDIIYLGLHFHYEEVGIRQKGNTSRGEILSNNKINLRHYKLSFEETFDDKYRKDPKSWDNSAAKAYREDRKFFGENKIDIRWNRNEDKTYIREYYAFEMYRNNGALSPRSNPVLVNMNIDGQKENLGVFLAVENINKSFIKRNFVKSARNGDLYKITWGSGVGGTLNDTSSNLFGVEEQFSNGDSFYQRSYTYDLKTNKDTSTHSTIKNFISTLSNTRGAGAYDFMSSNSVYASYLAYIACSYLLGDPDDLRGNYNNTYVYFTGDENKIIFIPTDNDRVLGATGNTGGDNPTGHHGARNNPFDYKTGYCGDNNSNLFHKTIFSSNSLTIRSDCIAKINEIIDNGWMDYSKYEALYNSCYFNYHDSLLLSSNINHSSLLFSTNEDNNLSSGLNLSVEKYLSTKKQTFLDYYLK